MNVKPINTTNFKGTVYNEKGNQYNKTNFGKCSGLLLGAGYTGYTIYNITGAGKVKYDKAISATIQQMLKDGYTKNVMKPLKNKAFVIGTFATAFIGLGLVLGGLADKLVNTVRSRQANRNAN